MKILITGTAGFIGFSLAKFLLEKTLLVVTHRKPILALTDRIIVVENGSIILDGKRDEILNKFS